MLLSRGFHRLSVERFGFVEPPLRTDHQAKVEQSVNRDIVIRAMAPNGDLKSLVE